VSSRVEVHRKGDFTVESSMIVRVVALAMAVIVVGVIILRRRKQKSA
jgi:hypothetical protein